MSPKAGLTRERIVEAALELADEQGAGALSMRALARRLGVDPMAVYRHVRDKAELLGAMCDATIAGLTPLDPAGPWEPQVRRLAQELREALLRRPSLVPVLLGAPATPAAVAMAQRGVALLVGAGLDEDAAARAFGATFSYVMGAIAVEVAGPPQAEDEDALRAAAAAVLQDPDAPHLDAAMRLMQVADDFTGGLDLLVAGIRAVAVR
jgi:TetR/AcrR family transcriptional regulator, tetracycline repressor protein